MTHIVVKITRRGRRNLYVGPSAAEAARVMRQARAGQGERIAYVSGVVK
jgi:hypothetical protein